MRIRILYHDHCFDGAASAAFFSRFMEDKFHPGAEFLFTGMAHKPSQIFEDDLFDGDENAIVDFKYSANPKLTWWFDHHQSAFLSQEDAEHYQRTKTEKKLYDPVSGPAPDSSARRRATNGATTPPIFTIWCTGPRSSTARCIPARKKRSILERRRCS